MDWQKKDAEEKRSARTVANPRVACLSCAHYNAPRNGGQRTRGLCQWWGRRSLWWSACSMWAGGDVPESWRDGWVERVDAKRGRGRK